MSAEQKCSARESGGVRCELPAGHPGEHWISERTIARRLSR